MQELIASYLIQKRECSLPLLGHFRIKTKSAEYDRADQQFFPPADEIIYGEFTGKLSGDLITYIATHKNISQATAEAEINDWCHKARKHVDLGNKIIFDSIGSLQKDATGNVFFQRRRATNFYDPVAAQRVVHKNADHSILVGDMETTSAVMNEFYHGETEAKPWFARWNVWAVILFAISVLILFFHFYLHKFSDTGNRSSIPVQNAPVLHSP